MTDDRMWCVVMFDLPTKTKQQRRDYTQFRNYLLDIGFVRTQYSVYSKFSPSGILSSREVKAIKTALPSGGEVRIMHVTDKQWANTVRFFNRTPKTVEEAPQQLAFF